MNSIDEKRRNDRMDKLISSQEKFVNSVSQIFFSNKTSKSSDISLKKDRFLVKKDITTELMKKDNALLDKILKISTENLKVNKSKKGNLLGGLGGSLALGGLAGFLLTGKEEHLFSLVKSLAKYLPTKALLKPIDGLIKKSIKIIIEGSKFLFTKPLDLIIKPLKGLFGFTKGIGDVLKPIKNIFGKGVGKSLSKGVGKGAGKSLFKKIPVVGSLLGLFFGIERFKKGDVIGGVGEISSGIASIFPGVGTAVSLVIDGLLMMKDFGVIGKKETENTFKSTPKSDIKDWPVLGSIIKAWEAIEKFTKDPIGSAKDLAESANKFIPGLGDGIMTGIGWIEALKNSAPAKFIGKGIDKVKNFGGDILNKVKDKLGDPISKITDSPKFVNVQEFMRDRINDLTNSGTTGHVSGIRLASKNVNIDGLNKDVYNNFIGMVNEYHEKTQKQVQVNSAYRSLEEQKKLFKTLPSGYVAAPGKSMHNFGYAIDINSSDVNKLNSLGLMKKWGFHQPIKNKEPWHIEPKGIDRVKIRTDNKEEMRSEIGDPVVEGDLNQKKADSRNFTVDNSKEYHNKEVVVKLSQETINKLAMKIAEETKHNVPIVRQKQNVVINSRL